jgi:hypothetical protein
MVKAFAGMGIAAESMASSLSYASNHGTGWLAVFIGLAIAAPTIHQLAIAFAYGESMDAFEW